MDAIRDFSGALWQSMYRGDIHAWGLALALAVAGLVCNYYAAKLGGRGIASVARLAWAGIRWLTRPRPLSELAGSILMTMQTTTMPREQYGQSIWYRNGLHVYPGAEIWLDAHTRVNHLLTRRECKRIWGQAKHDRDFQALLKGRGLWRDAETVELNPCV